MAVLFNMGRRVYDVCREGRCVMSACLEYLKIWVLQLGAIFPVLAVLDFGMGVQIIRDFGWGMAVIFVCSLIIYSEVYCYIYKKKPRD